MAMTVPHKKTISITCNNKVIYRDILIINLNIKEDKQKTLKELRDVCYSVKGMNYIISNMDFESAGYKVDDMIFKVEHKPCGSHIGCNKNGVHTNGCNK